MSLSFGNSWQGNMFGASAQPAANSNAQAHNGPDLEEIQTENLGFLAIAGEAKLQLLPSPWPADNLPPPTASLMSVASHKGLVAAAGPNAIVVATTESIRKAFEAPKSGDSQVRAFQPQLTLSMPMRVSQVTFTADENYLVLSAETGGGLAVYDVQSILNGSTNSAFEMSTNALAVRAIIPNPTQEKGELLALVTTDGKLMMANLKEKSFISEGNSQVLKEGVSCVSWSTRGKQLVAGLADGTGFQMTPEGQGKAEIPRPPNVDANHHVTSITWLENNVFLVVHTPTNFDNSSPPTSEFHIVTRNPSTPPQYMFQKIADPAGPFGLNRSPPHHFILRLKDFPPNLQDLLIVASTASTDIGLFSRSKTPLVSDKLAEKISGVFTMTEMSDDSRRAQLPMTEDMADTSPIGIALDLSSKDKVVKPIPSDEMDESQTPLPGFMLLNNEGVLASWWVVYSESIRQGTAYPGLAALAGGQQTTPAQTQSSSAPQTSAFGASMAKPAFGQSTFGTPSTQTSAFGGFSKPAAPTFGSASGLSKAQSPWATSSSTAPKLGSIGSGGLVFGSASTPNSGLAFGSSALPGNKASPWGPPANKPAGTAFGQPSGLGAATPSAFGVNTGTGTFGGGGTSAAPSSGGFASFANTGGFAAVAAKKPTEGSIFASHSTSFGATPSTTNTGTSFGSFGSKANETTGSLFGGSGFKLGSTFKPDESAKADASKPNNAGGSSFFGSNFGSALGEIPKAPETTASPEANMDADESESTQELAAPQETAPQADQASAPETQQSTTPSTTPVPQKFESQTAIPPVKGGLFGTPMTTPTANKDESSGTSMTATPSGISSTPGFSFGKPLGAREDTSGAHAAPKPLFGQPSTANKTETPKPLFDTPITSAPKSFELASATRGTVQVKQEPLSAEDAKKSLESISKAPISSGTTNKSTYTETDAPLPPDFMPPQSLPKPAENLGSSTPNPFPIAEVKKEDFIRADFIPPSDVPGGPEEEDDQSDFGSEDEGREGEVSEEEEGEQEDEDDDRDGESEFEGSGEDITKDLSPTSENNQTPGFSTQSSFGTAFGQDDAFTKISRPSELKPSRSLFGEIGTNSATILPPKPLTSPRSPSPIRGSIPGRLRPDASRSVSTPGTTSQLLAAKRSTGAPTSTYSLSLEQKRAEEWRKAEVIAKREAEESQALIDEDDISTQIYLNTDIVGTLHLDEFVAHQDYVGNADRNSIPAQVEAVYRDINSMIDTLGMNSRALKSFIKGHTEQYKDPPRTKEDLEGGNEWCLGEIENLSSIVEKDLTKELNEGCINDVSGKLEICTDLERDLARLRIKLDDIKMMMATHTDPEQLATIHSQPLTSEQAAQQHDLRRDFTNFQKMLAELEEGVIILRAKLASQPGTNGKAGHGPTVEAVMRTIVKMTNMVEKRSGDVDVLETQMRKLRMSSVGSNGSREGSPLSTPAHRSSTRNPLASSLASSRFYTPDSVRESPSRFRNSLRSSVNSLSGDSPARKKLSGFTDEDKRRLRNDAARRKEVAGKLKAVLQKSGTRMRLMDDEV